MMIEYVKEYFKLKAKASKDMFDNSEDAKKRGKELGLEGTHTHKDDTGKTVYMPGKSHEEYMKALKKKDQAIDPPEPNEDQDPSSAGYKYEDPRTGEVFTFKRRGVYKKNGRILIFVSKSDKYKDSSK
jgi:hypothetical protein|tara:strand:- start:137 stop:520 length:384 start_codon:yes stop_codon:yes gene_type:complete